MKNHSNQKTNVEAFWVILKSICSFFYLGWKKFDITNLRYLVSIQGIFLLSVIISCFFSWPEFFYAPPSLIQFLILNILLFVILLILMGIPSFYRGLSLQNTLKNATISNSKGCAPKVKSYKKHVDGTISMKLDAWGTDPQVFEKKRGIIETTFGLHVHDIKNTKSPRFKELLLTPKTLPKIFSFQDAIKHINSAYHVAIGMTMNGPLISNIRQWPHGLIAGSTGSGKSVQMKSIIAQFIHSSPNAKIILCDLKGGVEFSSFAGIKNVSIHSKIEEISHVLKETVRKMEKRFEFMKKKGIQKIIPEKHGKEFIFIASDESSLLYRRVSKDHPEYPSVESSRIATQKILKLGRAACISVLFGLQRPSKESIDTEIQENIDARMCFKINTVEGSVRMLGHKKGVDLPAIPGRGIWKFGNDERVFQAPLILDSDIQGLKSDQKESKESVTSEKNQEGSLSENPPQKSPPKKSTYKKMKRRNPNL